MPKRMTVVFHDEELYTELKVEAARRHTPASDIVAAAVREWLEQQEDAEIIPMIEKSRAEMEEKGTIPWAEVRERVLYISENKER